MKMKIISYIILPTAASVLMGIAIYYSLTGLVLPLSIIYIMIPLWIIFGVIIIYWRNKYTTVTSVKELSGEK